MKRFLNAFALRKKLAAIARLSNVRDEVLVKLMILEYAQPRAFRQLFEWQAAQGGTPQELRTMEVTLIGEAADSKDSTAELPWTSAFLHRMGPHGTGSCGHRSA